MPYRHHNGLAIVEYLTLAEAAAIGGFTDTSTLRQAIRRGSLAGVKIGRSWFTTEQWLADYTGRGRSHAELDAAALENARNDLTDALDTLKTLRSFTERPTSIDWSYTTDTVERAILWVDKLREQVDCQRQEARDGSQE